MPNSSNRSISGISSDKINDKEYLNNKIQFYRKSMEKKHQEVNFNFIRLTD